jgi:putative endonuclease
MGRDERRKRGDLGEQIAAEHLTHRGYEILVRNFRTRYGELDLIAANDQAIVFCEVKTRVIGTVAGPAGPLDAIGPRKRERLRRMAGQWLAETAAESRPRRDRLRFDAIGVTLTPAGALMALEHMEDAF